MSKLYVESYGAGKVLVLVHGWAMHTGIWRHFAQQLATNYQVICVDLPGHGRSENINPFTLAQLAEEILAVVPDQPCYWLGWSLGATVVLEVVRKHPERVESLLVLAGNPHFVSNEDWPGLPLNLLQTVASNLQQDYLATLLRFLGLQVQGVSNARAILKELQTLISECAWPKAETLQAGLLILRQTDLRSAVSDIKCPVMFILGVKDTLVPAATGAAVQKLLPNMEVVLIKNAGHVPFLTHPDEVIAALNRFIP